MRRYFYLYTAGVYCVYTKEREVPRNEKIDVLTAFPADVSEDAEPPAVVEAVEPEAPEEPLMPLMEEFPEDHSAGHYY